MSDYTPGRNFVVQGGTPKTAVPYSDYKQTPKWYLITGSNAIFAKNTVVTVSCDYTISNAASGNKSIFVQFRGTAGSSPRLYTEVTEGSGRFVSSFALNATQGNVNNRPYVQMSTSGSGDDSVVTFTNVKVELGTVENPEFRPAPEDNAEGFDYWSLGTAAVTLTHIVDIKAVYRFYKLQASTAAIPAKPTGIDTLPPAGWTDSEPAYRTDGTYTLYTVDLTVFSDDTFKYSDVMTDSSYEAAKAAWNKAFYAEQAAWEAGVANDIIIGTQTAATASWKGNATFSELRDGMSILYWLPMTSASNATLNLTLADGTQTGAVAVYYSGTTRVGTHYAAGSVIRLTYRHETTIGTGTTKYTGWWCDANYDSGNTYDRIRLNNGVIAETACTAGKIIVYCGSGYRNFAAGQAVRLDMPILYCGTSIKAAASGNNNYLSFPSVRTTTTLPDFDGTAQQAIYIKGSMDGQVFNVDASDPWTCDIPTAEDGKEYILLGFCSSLTYMYLYPEHPIFKFEGGEFKNISQIAYEAKASATQTAETVEQHTAHLEQHDTEIAARVESSYLSQITDGMQSADELIKVQGQKLRISFDYSVSGAAYYNGSRPDIYAQLNTDQTVNDIVRVYLDSESQSGHVSKVCTVTAAQAAYTSRAQIRFRLRNAANGARMTLSNIMVTLGTEEYAYAPAPEDSGIIQVGGYYPGRNLLLNGQEEYTSNASSSGSVLSKNWYFTQGNTGLNHTLTSLEQQTADLRISSDNITASVTNIQSRTNDLETDLSTTAENLTNLQNDVTNNYARKSEIEQTASSITARISAAEGDLSTFRTQTEAMLDSEGLHISTANSPTTSKIDGDGLEITDNSGKVLAKFTTGKSEIDSVRVTGTLEFGAHQIETTTKTEWDGTSTAGTAFLWIGPVED